MESGVLDVEVVVCAHNSFRRNRTKPILQETVSLVGS